MTATNNSILVTWDFTEKSEYALQHALQIAENLQSSITLIHIVKRETEIVSTVERIKGILSERYRNIRVPIDVLVKEGSIFSTITEEANEAGVHMTIMGTHGIRGMQKVFGSWALKVIAHTKTPFVVVQEDPKQHVFKDIVVPLNFRKENKECVNWAAYFAKHFGSKFHLFTAKHTDHNFVKGLESNLFFIRKFFQSRGIDFSIEKCEGDGEYTRELMKYAKSVNAGSIMLMTTRDIKFTDYVLGAEEQYIIANEEKIPVVCINPKPPKFGGSFSTAGG